MEQTQIIDKRHNFPADDIKAATLNLDVPSLLANYGHLTGDELLRVMLTDVFPGRIAVASSFGAESVVLLDLVAKIDPATPILFGNTLKLFPETLAYVQQLTDALGLTDIHHLKPDLKAVQTEDSEGMLWRSNPDRCCELRKVKPFQIGLEGYSAWITGRKRFQSDTRAKLPLIESDGPRVKINPLADWTSEDIAAYIEKEGLPEHPLKKHGFLSLGCATCTRAVKDGEDQRAGRWAGREKIECGIHFIGGRPVRTG